MVEERKFAIIGYEEIMQKKLTSRGRTLSPLPSPQYLTNITEYSMMRIFNESIIAIR